MRYACEMTNGCCLYCGKELYEEDKNGEYVIKKGIHWDHVYPASRFNLFTAGNVALACNECNLRKNATDPYQYYLEKKAAKEPVFIQSKKDFKKFLKKYTKPYKQEYKKFWKVGVRSELRGLRADLIIKELFFRKDDGFGSSLVIGATTDKYNYKTSINALFYRELNDYINSLPLADDTKSSMTTRVGFMQETLSDLFGENTDILELSDKDMNKLFIEVMSRRPNKKGFNCYRNLFGKMIDFIYKDDSSLIQLKRRTIIPSMKDIPVEIV